MTPPALQLCEVEPHITASPFDESLTGCTDTAPRRTLIPDIDQARLLLNALDPAVENHYFQTFPDGAKNARLISQHFASLDEAKVNLTSLNGASAGVFVTINETNGTGRSAKDITRIRALFLDYDDEATAADLLAKLTEKLVPSIIVESSRGKFHAYYLVSDLPIGDAKRWLKHLIAQAGSDPACCDISRVLRLPGFYHRKGVPFMTRIHSIANDGAPIPYPVADLERAFGSPPVEPQKQSRPTSARTSATIVDGAIDLTIAEGGRNSTLASLAGTMRSRGMGEAAILAALQAENASRCVPPLDDAEVASIAASIASYAPSNEGDSATGETPDQVITRLSQLSAIQYDQVRTAEAKGLRVRTSTLDKMVSSARGDCSSQVDAPFVEVEPWDTPVDADELLTEIVEAIRRHIVCDRETATAAALWVAMTYLVDQFDVAPLAVITAPEPRCGKSEFRRLLGKMVFRAMHADGMSAAVLFRSFDLWTPTLMIDEYDTFIGDNEELRGIFNSGHQRGGKVWRCVGDDHTPTAFNVYGPKLLAGIGKLPATIADRSIQLELRRKLPAETVMRQRDVDPASFVILQRKLMRFAEDYSDAIRAARPVMPPELNDRQQDNWESLFQIAMAAGGDWPELANSAALKLSNAKEDARSRRIELLEDIRDIFDLFAGSRASISTAELIKLLCGDEEMSWATYNRGQPITPRQLAKLLKDFGIVTGSVRLGAMTAKGYQRSSFQDVFARYL